MAHIRGQTVPYTATVAEDIIKDGRGAPGAAVVTIAYTRDGEKDPLHRPVLFAFNGGPGASSSPLHMSALGPIYRTDTVAGNHDAARLEDNTDSPLDAADLVFIDPVSTGFSRALPGIDPKQWYSGKADALEVKTVIEDWLKSRHRSGSPRYLAGESYGTVRAGLIVKYAPELKWNGVLLISGGGGSSGPHSHEINSVAPMAVGAWFHNKIDRQGRSIEQMFKEANEFAHTQYAAALAKGDAMAPAERGRIAGRLSALIGLPVELLEQNDLRISENLYMFNLLKEQGLRTGLLDTRATSVLMKNSAGAIDDPALGVVKPQANGPVPTPEAVGAVTSPVVGGYIIGELKFPTKDPYYGVNFTANAAWSYEGSADDPESGTAGILAAALKTDPGLRLLVANGYYDLTAGDGSGFIQAGVPADRLTLLMLAGPHQVYEGIDNRKSFNDAVRKFVAAGHP